MTKDKAIHKYFEDFMKIAFPDAPVKDDDYHATYIKVPKDAILPYLVYPFIDSEFGEGDISVPVKIWAMIESEAKMNDIARQLKLYVKEHSEIECDTGRLWVKLGHPFSQKIDTEWEGGPNGRYINLIIEDLTRY